MSHSRGCPSNRALRALFVLAAGVTAFVCAPRAFADDALSPPVTAAVATAPASATATVAAQPAPTVAVEVSTAAGTAAAATAAVPATPAAPVQAAASVHTPVASAHVGSPAHEPARPVAAPATAAPTPVATAPRATRATAPRIHAKIRRDRTEVRSAEHERSSKPAVVAAGTPPARDVTPATHISLPSADTPAGSAASLASPRAPQLPAWPEVPAGTTGLGTGAGGPSSSLLLFALILGLLLFSVPSLGSPLPIRLPGAKPARLHSRLERPG